MTEAVLEIAGLTVSYGQVRAVSDIHLSVQSGQITTLIGSNGSGKTTIMKGITGLTQAAADDARCRGEQLVGKQVDAIVAAGISLVPEGRSLFPTMSIRENLEIGAYRRTDAGAVRDDFERVLCYFPVLRERLGSRAMALSGRPNRSCWSRTMGQLMSASYHGRLLPPDRTGSRWSGCPNTRPN